MRPASSVAALAGGAVAILAVGIVGAVWAGAGLVGLALLGAGLLRESERLCSVGGVALLATVAAAGFAGLGPGFVLLGTLGAVVAWDAGTHGIGLADHLTAEGRGTRAELVHVGATLVVVSGIAGLVFAVTVFGDAIVTTSAVAVVLLVGVVLLAVGLEPRGAG